MLQFIEEMVSFPNSAHDDSVDAASQLLNYWLDGWKMGLIDLIKEESEMREKKRSVETGDNTVQCPACLSAVTTWHPTQGYRCSECGKQWGATGGAIEMPRRGLSGGRGMLELPSGRGGLGDAVARFGR